MLASEIISRILKRHEALCAKYPQLVDFLPNSKGDSFYLIIDGNDEATPIQIRISSHETNIESWIDEKEWGNKFKRVNPSSYVNISIVFIDEGKDSSDSPNGKKKHKVKSYKNRTIEGKDQIGKPYYVHEFVFNSKFIKRQFVQEITKHITNAVMSIVGANSHTKKQLSVF